MTAPSAHWPVYQLIDALARAQWGGTLGGRDAIPGMRTVLRGLTALLPYKSGEGSITAGQVADATGLCLRWARTCLARLEDAGIIVYRRGWLDRGRPKPGHVRIIKSRLVELLLLARGDDLAAAVLRKRREQREQRLAGLAKTTIRRQRRRFPLSKGVELNASPPPYREEPARPERPPAQVCAHCGHNEALHGFWIASRRHQEHRWTPSPG